MSETWRAFGTLPAAPVVAAYIAAAILATLILGDDATPFVLALIAALALYCLARPAGGMDVFLIAAIPSASASLLEAAGAPAWLAIPLIPVAVLLAASEDREARA